MFFGHLDNFLNKKRKEMKKNLIKKEKFCAKKRKIVTKSRIDKKSVYGRLHLVESTDYFLLYLMIPKLIFST